MHPITWEDKKKSSFIELFNTVTKSNRLKKNVFQGNSKTRTPHTCSPTSLSP
jgi:hypothetical protein